MNRENFTAVFRDVLGKSLYSLEVCEIIFGKIGINSNGALIFGKKMTSPMAKAFKEINREGYSITLENCEIHFGFDPNANLSFFALECNDPIINKNFEMWMDFYKNDKDFIMAWVADENYEHWQNAHDPLQYASVGRPYKHLPMVSNNLPYPLTQMNIDTSKNPGRRIYKKGYIEAVGATMWLSQPFFKLTGADLETVRNTPWLNVTDASDTVIKIRAADHCFTSDEGEEGELQRKLRAILFPESIAADKS
jgi:hypothetical protein